MVYFLRALLRGILRLPGYSPASSDPQTNGIAGSAAVSAPFALEENVAGHAIVIHSGVARCVQVRKNLPVRQES